jgi:hypothetical protein
VQPLATAAEKAPSLRAAAARGLPAALPLALVALIAAPVLDPGVQLFFRDTGRLYYPVKRYIAERLARGELPLWYPWSEAGTSLLGQVTPGLFHPFTLLYAALPFELAFKLNHLLALPVAAVGMYLLARRLASPWAAACASVAFAGSGYVLSMAGSNLPYALGASSLPWSLWGLLRFIDAPSPSRLLAGAALLALPALAGEPQSMLLAGVIGAAWVVGRALSAQGPPATRARGAARAGLSVALWGALALLLAGPASAPAAARLAQSPRAAGVTAREADRFWTHPARLLGLLVPVAFDDASDAPLLGTKTQVRPFKEFFHNDDFAFSASILIGAPALLLALAGAARRPGRFLLLGALVVLMASTGPVAGVHDALVTFVPGFRFFRYAEKLMAPATLLLCLSAAVGADAALAGTKRAAVAFSAVAALLGALLLGAGALARANPEVLSAWLIQRGRWHVPPHARWMADALASGLLLAGGLALAVALAGLLRTGRSSGAALALAALACAASTLLGARSAIPFGPIDLFHGPFLLAEELAQRGGPSEGRWRLFTPSNPAMRLPPLGSAGLALEAASAQALLPQREVVARIEGVAPYFSAMDLPYLSSLREHVWRTMRLLNVRFATASPLELSEAAARKAGYAMSRAGFWVKDLGPSPRAFLVDGARALPADRGWRLIGEKGFDVLRTAVLPLAEEPIAAKLLPEGTGAPGSAALQTSRPERLVADVDANRDALLLLSTHWDGGWRAAVDGKPAPVSRVDFVVLGVPVPAGRHRVELGFHPEGLGPGLWMLASGLALCGAWAATRSFGRRRVAS